MQTKDRRQLQQGHGEAPRRAASNVNPPFTKGDIGSPAFEARSGPAQDRLRTGNFNLDLHLREQEACYIGAALELSSGNISEAAKLLGINRTTLHSRMDAHEKLKP